jgi:uncharacterized RDD family membrane protein YckC
MAVVYLERDGQQFGPFSIEEAKRYIVEGRFGAQDLAWIDGMQEWLLVAQIPQLTAGQANPPNLAKPAPAAPTMPPAPIAPAYAPYTAPSFPGPTSYSGPQHPAFAAPQDFSQADYAGFWRRAAALMIDSIIVTVVVYFFMFVLMLMFGLGMGATGMNGLESSDATTNAIAIATIAFPALLTISYYAIWHASASMATPGKMAAGLVVVNSSAQRISVPQSFLREFVKLVGTWFFFLTFATQPISARRQAIHDFASATVVLRKRPDAGMPSVVVWLINLSWGTLLLIAIAVLVAFAQ